MGLRVYERFSWRIVAFVALTLPLALFASLRVRSDNDLNTWLPRNSEARRDYEAFKQVFGAEDFLLVAFDLNQPDAPDEKLVESVCVRLQRLPSVERCWSPQRMREAMQNLGVAPEECERRMKRLLVGEKSGMIGVAVTLSERGAADRAGTVREIRQELAYCRLGGDNSFLAGSPLFVSELDRLGGKDAGAPYLCATLCICGVLLFYLIREWKLTALVFGLTVWTISVNTVLLDRVGIPMNFLLASIPILVMVLTMSACVHYLHYYREALDRRSPDPIHDALREAFWPALIATATTCLGEMSLSVSDIATIQQFAYASTIGSVISFVAALGITPAIVKVCPTLTARTPQTTVRESRFATWIVFRSRGLVMTCVAATIVTCFGLSRLQSDLCVADFLPEESRVRQDFLRIERDLARVDSMEAIVDFGRDRHSFVDKLQRVRKIEQILRSHPAVDQTLSLTSFFPDPLPQDALGLATILTTAQQSRGKSELTAGHEQQMWRISLRIRRDQEQTRGRTIAELKSLLAGEPVWLTGMAALVEGTQEEIFASFWASIVLALALVTLAMMAFLRSVTVGVLAMIPNIAPLCWIYGMIGWFGWPVDVAMMLSGSIALGLSVDGTFHFLAHFRSHLRRTGSAALATRQALLESGIPFIQATLTACAGMVSLTFSPFQPTVRFGCLMMALMLAALVGDVLMLPSLTCLWWRLAPGKSKGAAPEPAVGMKSAA